jgi:Ulp1 family protease
MSRRLSNVVVAVIKGKRRSSSVITKIENLGYQAHPEKSLWRLKAKEYLDDKVINAYLELLRNSGVAESQSI